MTRQHYDWPGIITDAAASPGWRMLFANSPTRLAKRIRLRQHPALRRDDGVLEVMVLNEYREPGSPARGDIWVRWVPTPNPRNTREIP